MARRSRKSDKSSADHLHDTDMNTDTDGAAQRLDKWLWHARFIRTRSAATALVDKSRFRINGRTGIKPSANVKPGDVLTFTLSKRVRVIRVDGIAEKRGGAPDAALLYTDLDTDRQSDD